MTCSYTSKKIKGVISFHGHSCPGLAIGIRAAEYARNEFPDSSPETLVCVTETDMCGVDAIQYLTGCTYGKGNLVHLDYGKVAFSFYDRQKNCGFRFALRDGARGNIHEKVDLLMRKKKERTISQEENEVLEQLREEMKANLMNTPLTELFHKSPLKENPPGPARVLMSLECETCHEKTMESRTRRVDGKTLCIPCFGRVEQKV